MDDGIKFMIGKIIAEKLNSASEEPKLGSPIPLTGEAKAVYREYLRKQDELIRELRAVTQRGEVLSKRLDANKAEFFERIEQLMPEVAAGGHGCHINPKDATAQVVLCTEGCDQHPVREPPDWVKEMLEKGDV